MKDKVGMGIDAIGYYHSCIPQFSSKNCSTVANKIIEILPIQAMGYTSSVEMIFERAVNLGTD